MRQSKSQLIEMRERKQGTHELGDTLLKLKIGLQDQQYLHFPQRNS